MIEKEIKDLTKLNDTPQYKKKIIKSPFFEGSVNELHVTYLQYRVLYELSKIVTSKTSINEIMDVLLDEIIILSGAERGLVILFDNNGGPVSQNGRNINQEELASPGFEVSWSIITKVRETRTHLFLENALENEEFKKSKSVFRLKILSVLCFPIIHNNQLIGVTYLDSRTLQGVFKIETFHLLQKVVPLINGPLAAALKSKMLENDFNKLKTQIEDRIKYGAIIGTSPKMLEVLKFVDMVADTNASILIEGESGTGKELVARALHDNSRRCQESFVSLNCGALPETLLESELFGSIKGAYTGSVIDKKGWFEIADGGTIFFDEIGEMSPSLQIKLLRVLQTGEYAPVGSTEIKKCDVRVLTATHQHLDELVGRGLFREDLYYRINVISVTLPPLRERNNDVLLLANYFLQAFGKQNDKEDLKLSQEVEKVLSDYSFPGNVRELENAMQGAAILAEGNQVELRHLSEAFKKKAKPIKSHQGPFADAKQNAIENFEYEYVENALRNANGVVLHAAKTTGMDPKNLYKKMEKYKIKPARFKN